MSDPPLDVTHPIGPPPPVDPVPDDHADRVLAAAVRPWAYQIHIGSNKTAATAVAVWLRNRGL